jgi:hypothetical protein
MSLRNTEKKKYRDKIQQNVGIFCWLLLFLDNESDRIIKPLKLFGWVILLGSEMKI